MAAPEEIDVLFDANTASIKNAFEFLNSELAKVQTKVQNIGKDTYKNLSDAGKVVSAQLKDMRELQNQLRTLRNSPLATNYDSAIKGEAQKAKIFFKEVETERLASAKRVAAAEVEGARIVAQANRATIDADLANDKKRIEATKLRTAAKIEATRADVRANAEAIRSEEQLSNARAANIDKLRQYRAAARLESDPSQLRALQTLIALERERGTALEQTARKMETASARINNLSFGSARRLVPSQIQDTISATGSAATALSQFKNQQSVATAALNAATGEKQILQAQKALDLAKLRVDATQRIVIAEERAAAVLARSNAQQGSGKSPIQSILSPGYAGAAIARTGVYGLAAGAAYGAFNAVSSSLSNVKELEDELQKLQAISNSTDTEMQSLKSSIYAIGDNSRYAVNDLVKISQVLAQAGVSAQDMTDVLKSVTTLATASGSTPDEAVNLVTSALGAFQLQASEAGRIADLMTEALNRTKLTVQQVGAAIQYVGATAYEQNISLENLLATIGAVAQGGIKSGSTIGTGFRQFLVDLQTPSEKLTFQLDRLGITQDEVNVKTKGLSAVLDTLKTKGFGATQAYEGLETRAAAFYLVAKNNTDVIDELQLSFAQQGAAAIANERAMNSLTAQWQRFKNILQEGLGDNLDGTMNVLKNILKSLSDRILEMRTEAVRLKNAQVTGTSGLLENNGAKAADLAQRGLDWLSPHTSGRVTDLNSVSGSRLTTGPGLGTWLKSWSEDAQDAAKNTDIYADAIKSASGDVDTHSQRIIEVDKELERLKAQQASLQGNTKRTAAETVTLTARFQGLVGFLGTTKDSYLDLINAMNRYRGEESAFLAKSYDAQASAQSSQNNLDKTSLAGKISSISSNRQLLGQMTPSERAALGNTSDINFPARMKEAADRVAKSNTGLAQVLYDAAAIANRLSFGVGIASRAGTQAGLARGAATSLGVNSESYLSTTQRNLEALTGKTPDQRKTGGNAIISGVNTHISNLEKRLGTLKDPGNKAYVQQLIDQFKSLLQQVVAAMKPSADEIKKAKADEREANKRPKVTQGDLDSILTSVGATLGSGPRTAAEQDALHRAGVTNLTSKNSPHVVSVARDVKLGGMSDADANNLAATIRARLQQAGIDAQVKFEGGKGKNQGTGRHIHVGVRNGATLGRDRSETNIDQVQSQLSQDQLGLDQTEMADKLKKLKAANSEAAFQSAYDDAVHATNVVRNQLVKAAKDELAAKGISANSPQYKAKIAQVMQEQQANIDALGDVVSDGIIKTMKQQVDAATTAFEASLKGPNNVLAVANARVAGLDLQSNALKVPEYVKALASRNVGVASESLDRATLSSLSPRITDTQLALNNAQAKSGLIGPDDSEGRVKLNQEIKDLTNSLKDLETQRDSLTAKLGAGGLIPTTISGGLELAIQNFREANDVTKTLKDTIIMNLGGAIDQVQSGLTSMFDSIFTGSRTALQAFGDFAKGIGRYLSQLAAQFVANQIISQILNLVGGKFASQSAAQGAFASTAAASSAGRTLFRFNGGPIPGYVGGGRVTNGSPLKDSTLAALAKDEWVVNKRAVDSVGHGFMADLNANGAAAVAARTGMPQIQPALQQTGVYVVAPNRVPQLGKNDILVTIQEDMLQGGETAKLVKMVSNG